MQEDHVSMGWGAGRKLRRAVDGLTRVLAIEVLTAARALDLRAPLRPAPGTAAAVAALRERVPGPGRTATCHPRSRPPSPPCAAESCWPPCRPSSDPWKEHA
jgi:hypothetical protein